MNVKIVEETKTYADVDQAFSVREVPWMKMGKLLSQPVTAKEAAELGGLNFKVELREVGIIVSDTTDLTYQAAFPDSKTRAGTFQKIDKRRAVVATDNGQFMGFVSSKKYNMLQYGEAFDFMDTINPVYVAAGTLRDRRQGFMVVKPDVDFQVLDGDDPHDLFVTMRTSHDCTRGIEVMVMPLRDRCMNQLSLRSFAKGVQHRWSIKHTSTMQAKLAEAQKSLKKIGLYAKRFQEVAQRCVDVQLSQGQAHELLKITIPAPRTGATPRVQEQYTDRLNAILELWQTSPTVAYAGTGWGLVNAVSEHYDWYRTGGTPESRFLNALEGQTHKAINTITGLVLADA
jgi:phage/plasmid-like protein (TIGR03299 family)